MAKVAIIGAGPAGLIAAEHLAGIGHRVTVYDQMPSPARKFLLAGRGGLNLTHTEPPPAFLARYGLAADFLAPALAGFTAQDLIAWCENLGQPVYVGSSGRVFPRVFKTAPLLRAWLRRLDGMGVVFAPRHQWLGWAGPAWHFGTPDGDVAVTADATLLALGGASWPRMGATGAWTSILRARGVKIADLRPSNCAVRIAWSDVLVARFAGQPLKRIAVTAAGQTMRGEAVITQTGLEGGAVYALSGLLRAALDADGGAELTVDLRPDIAMADMAARVDGARQGQSLPNFLRRQIKLSPAAVGLVQEALHAGKASMRLSQLIKAMPLTVSALAPIDRAISSAGGIMRGELDAHLMIERLPGVFAAGEMLDWEAPTGGYLLQACFSTGMLAACGMASWLAENAPLA